MDQRYIYIGQYHGTSLVSRLIKWRTWSDISHTAAWMLKPDDGSWLVIEAWGGGVRVRPWKKGHTPGTEITLYRVPCTEDQADQFYRFLMGEVGKPYDWFAILGFALRAKTQSTKKWFCSELVCSAARAAGINLLARIEPHKISPGQVNISPRLEYLRTLHVPPEDKADNG